MGLDTVELIIEIEKRFDIHIEDVRAEKIGTIEDLIVAIEEIKTDHSMNREEITEKVLDLVSYVSGIEVSKLNLSDSFTNDLGMD